MSINGLWELGYGETAQLSPQIRNITRIYKAFERRIKRPHENFEQFLNPQKPTARHLAQPL